MNEPSKTPQRDAGNRLLATLAPAEFERMEPFFERVTLSPGLTLIEPNSPIGHVYFPETGMVSLVQPLANGAMVEVALVGGEGMVGVPLLLGADRWPIEAMVQMPGFALRMRAADLFKATDRNIVFRQLLLRYAQALFVQVTQSGACNSQHVLNQRLARWLLLAHDRAVGDELKLSHKFIGMMLGIRRSSVTVALANFKAGGILATKHGLVTILDRAALERAACECYRSVRDEVDRLLR